jgi:hypothetical protein
MGGEPQIGDLLAEIKGGGRTGRHEGRCLVFFILANAASRSSADLISTGGERAEIASRRVLPCLLNECLVVSRVRADL